MTKKPKRQNLRPPGKCLFCGGGGVPGNKMTKEHIWSDWTKKIIPKADYRFEERVAVTTVNGGPVLINEPSTRKPGAVHRRQAKIVCCKCNGSWMKRIVDNAKPTATATMLGTPTVLNAVAQQHLASWVALSAIIADSQMKGPDKIPSEDIEYISKNGLPPPRWLIGIGSYRGSTGVSANYNVLPAVSYDAAGNRILHFKVHTITTIMMGLYVLVQLVTPADAVTIDFSNEYSPHLRQVWPPRTEDINWPFAEIVTISGNGSFNPRGASLDMALAVKVAQRIAAGHQGTPQF